MECAQQGERQTQEELARISAIAGSFRKQALNLGAVQSVVFATEAIRQVATSAIFQSSPLAAEIDQILDQRAEAECSLFAGIVGLGSARLKGNAILLIDQGAGSMELVTGKCGPPIELIDFSGAKLGGNATLQFLREQQLSVERLRAVVIPILGLCRIPTGEIDEVVIQGTVATKCAWLMERNNLRERYEQRRVHGKVVKVQVLEELVSAAKKFSRKSWVEFQSLVNPDEPNGDAGERLVSGAVPLLYLLKHLQKTQFVVSALGTRHGVAWRLSQTLLPQQSAIKDDLVQSSSSKDIGRGASTKSSDDRMKSVEVVRTPSKRKKLSKESESLTNSKPR